MRAAAGTGPGGCAFGMRGHQTDSPRRGKQRDGLRIHNLKKIGGRDVNHERGDNESDEDKTPPARLVPVENELRGGGRAHFGRAPANETDEIPCSSAALVTATTNSYGVWRSALIIMERFSRLASSSNGPSPSSEVF